MQYPFADLALSRRLENAEARTNADFVESHAALQPRSGAMWKEVGGAYAMFDGPTSPLTQTFRLGIFEPATEATLQQLEHFFEERGAEIDHEVSPLADEATITLLKKRGYQPIEFTSIMFMPIERDVAFESEGRATVRIARKGEEEEWARLAAHGWSDFPGLEDFMNDLGRITANSRGITPFFAEIEGKPVATGSLSIQDGVALFAGASTIHEARKQGAQRALLHARMRFAAEHGCDLAMMGALPGSESQRNAERQGFRIAYTRIKWRKQRHSALIDSP
jgi:hypothetical protein